jgi:hypothetical protein
LPSSEAGGREINADQRENRFPAEAIAADADMRQARRPGSAQQRCFSWKNPSKLWMDADPTLKLSAAPFGAFT